MKNNIRLTAMLFITTFIFTAMLAVCAPAQAAAATPTLSGAQISAARGETVLFAVSIKDNPGLNACRVYLTCNNSVFSVHYDEETDSYAISSGSVWDGQGSFTGNYVNQSYSASCYLPTGFISNDGDLFIFELEVDDDAPYGKYPITVQYNQDDTLDAQLNPIDLATVNGSISVGPPTFRGTNVDAHPGETINYAVEIEHNPGLAACIVYISSADNILAPVPSADGYAVNRGDFSDTGAVVANQREVEEAWQESDGWQVLWYANSNAEGEGSLFTMSFQVKDDVAPGVYPVTISYSTVDTVQADDQQLTFVTVDGSITVTNIDISGSSAGYDDGEKSVTVSISAVDCRVIAEKTPVRFIAAVYDESGRMLGCSMHNASDLTTNYAHALAVNNINAAQKLTVKLFALEGGGSAKPLCACYTTTVYSSTVE